MVVVNGGENLIGAGQVSLVVSSIVPTSAGRMVFARPNDPGGPDPAPSAAEAFSAAVEHVDTVVPAREEAEDEADAPSSRQ